MTAPRYRYVFLGLSITSSWGNGHATTYRALLRALAARGHEVLFLERDRPYYAANRDLPCPPFARTELYSSLDELRDRFADDVRGADLVVVGSYVPDGTLVGEWVTSIAQRGRAAFYDIDTPITLRKMMRGDDEYISSALVPRYGLYLSFTGGPTLALLERRFGATAARPLYCSVDPDLYSPEEIEPRWDLGYLGTYSDDRQPALDRLLLEPASTWADGRFIVCGAQYPRDLLLPPNVERLTHLPPIEHSRFYSGQRFTLNITRDAMMRSGWSPSVRLFEAAACATPILSDRWKGLEHFLQPGKEILVVDSPGAVLGYLRDLSVRDRVAIGQAARLRVLAEHTSGHRAEALEGYTRELFTERASSAMPRRYANAQ